MSDPIELPSLDPLMAEVGRGIAAFASVESFLALMYSTMMQPAPSKLSLLSFDAARHIEIKCRMLASIAPHCLEPDQLAQFEKIMQRVKRKALTRHKLAHWQVSHWHKDQPITTTEQVKEMQPKLMAPYYSAGNLDFIPDSVMGMSEVQDFRSGCLKLANDIIEFNTQFPLRQNSSN